MEIEVSDSHWPVEYFKVENIYSCNHLLSILSKLRYSLIFIKLLVVISNKLIAVLSYHR